MLFCATFSKFSKNIFSTFFNSFVLTVGEEVQQKCGSDDIDLTQTLISHPTCQFILGERGAGPGSHGAGNDACLVFTLLCRAAVLLLQSLLLLQGTAEF